MASKKKNKNNDAQWYIITIISGNEDTVVKNLKGKIEAYGLSDLIHDIKVIKEAVTTEEIFAEDELPSSYGKKMKNISWETFVDANGKTKYKRIKTSYVNKFFGYIFIKMVMTDDAWYAIRNTQLITGIVGSSGQNAKPIPVGDDEINALLNVETSKGETAVVDGSLVSSTDDAIIVEKKKYVPNFSVGQKVLIINGNMKDQKGEVVRIDEDRGVASVLIDIFGRSTDVEVNFDDVEIDNE